MTAEQHKQLDDLLDELVAEYSDQLQSGREPQEQAFLERVPAANRESLGRCLRMLRAGARDLPRPLTPLVQGALLGGYEILEELGRGGMAVVYRARQPELQRDVALKVLRPGLALEARHVDRFRREGLAIARLSHPHIVGVHDVGEDGGYHYLAMECVRGTNLAAVIERLPRDVDPGDWTAGDLELAVGVPGLFAGAQSYEQALARLLEPIARALGLAHELGLLHRDVKPSNILIHADGRAVLADFGLAKGDGDPGLSLSGEPLGTPYYMSPEQALAVGQPVDERSDVYSLGVTLYEALSGRRPFEGQTLLAVLDSIRQGTPASLRSVARSRSGEAQAIVERAMASEREQRYARALDLASDLTALAEGRPSQAYAVLGGPWKRARRVVGQLCSGRSFEFRSNTTLLGWPLVHILGGPRLQGSPKVARGWFAFGPVAMGAFACGGLTLGLVSFGGLALGLLLALGGVAGGLRPAGGLAVGGFPTGGGSVGYAAIGGLAVGYYAMGGGAFGTHTLDGRSGPDRDPRAVEFFSAWLDRDPLVPARGLLRTQLLGQPQSAAAR